MKALFGLSRLSKPELKLLPETVLHLFVFRIKVSFLPSKNYLPKNTRQTGFLSEEKKNQSNSVARIINGLSVRVPWPATCLVKVLAANKMLLKRGIPHTIHFGVKKSAAGEMEAHAWLSVNNRVVIGGENLLDFKEINRIIL
jgi:hypothetical protein